MKNSKSIIGIILIIIGVLALLNNILPLKIFSIGTFWPLIILVIGLFFEAAYFSNNKGIGLLIPGGILITLGLLFSFETITRWSFSAYTWPIYPLSVAIGLFQVYIFGERKKALLIPIGILTMVSFTAFSCMLFGHVIKNIGIIFAILFIAAGCYLIFKEKL